MGTVTSTLVNGVHFTTDIRGHVIDTDGPPEAGGVNAGPTPPEMVAMALGTCVGIYAVMFCNKHGISTEGLSIRTDWEKVEGPTRIGRLHVDIDLPAGVPEDKMDAFMKTVHQCMVHNTLCNMPDVHVTVAK